MSLGSVARQELRRVECRVPAELLPRVVVNGSGAMWLRRVD